MSYWIMMSRVGPKRNIAIEQNYKMTLRFFSVGLQHPFQGSVDADDPANTLLELRLYLCHDA